MVKFSWIMCSHALWGNHKLISFFLKSKKRINDVASLATFAKQNRYRVFLLKLLLEVRIDRRHGNIMVRCSCKESKPNTRRKGGNPSVKRKILIQLGTPVSLHPANSLNIPLCWQEKFGIFRVQEKVVWWEIRGKKRAGGRERKRPANMVTFFPT